MKKIVFFIVTTLLLVSCGGASSIEVSDNQVSFSIEGGEKSVNVTADGTWSVSDSPDWINTDAQNGVIIIRTARNESGAVREGNIALKGKSGVEATIKVKQFSKCTHITAASSKVEFEKEGGTETIAIDTDGSLQVEAPEGFSASYENGNLTVTAQANEGGAKRGEIKLTCDDQSATIYASQKGNVCQRCGGTGKITCPKCKGKGLVHVYVNPEFVDPSIVPDQQPCEKCGGYWDGTTEFTAEWRQGSGHIKCPDCGGTGTGH